MTRKNASERHVAQALEEQSQPGDVILSGVRFTDPNNGDVEADFLLLIPGHGIAAIEVKGGRVTYADGEWRVNGLKDLDYSRRIHPVEQARKAKHAVRRYLDRQPEWNAGLIRAEWIVVLPETEVTGDLGPEGLRAHLVGKHDLPNLRATAISLLDRSSLTEPRPTPEQIEDAVSLLYRSTASSPAPTQRATTPWFKVPVSTPKRRWATALVLTGITAAALLIPRMGSTPAVSETGCSPDYSPCIPVAEDLNCPDIRMQVEVIGEDIYGLDRDGNGLGCEMFAVPLTQ